MQKFRFLEWKVYNDSQDLFSIILKIVHALPKGYRYDIGSQLIRAALSITLNIAEGSGRHSDKELNRYFDIALGSVYEVLAVADTLRKNTLISVPEFNGIMEYSEKIGNQLGGFKKILK